MEDSTDKVVEELAKKAEEDRLVLIAYLFGHCPRAIRENLPFHLMRLGLEADFVSGLIAESLTVHKQRSRTKN